VKHFPGHGRTRSNSHEEGSAIAATRAELELDLKPFRAAFAAGVGGLMTAHVAYPALDSSGLAASVSPRILNGIARKELGFDGLIVTDALEMRGLTVNQTESGAALAAIAAGADLLMGPATPQEVHARLAQAMAATDATHLRQRLVESYGRIIATKRRFGILTRAR
jgi:beta-N-acetylhexosaminidase